jgi:O-antigen/teichoic acid export membrane protein
MKKQTRQILYNYSYDESPGVQLGIKALRGVGWSSLTNVGIQVTRFGIFFVLARFLSPGDFGLVGMAVAAIAFAQVFQAGGLGIALIQRKTLTESQVSGSFWAIACLGSCLTVMLLAASSWVGRFYENQQVVPVLAALSFSFLFGALTVVPRALITRAIDFRKLFFIETGSALLGGVIALVAAYQGFGVWSLVAGSLAECLCKMILLWAYTRWLPKMMFEFDSLKPLLPVALPVLGFAMVNYFAMNMDYLIIGKYLGPVALGLYTLAYKIMLMPLSQVSGAVASVALPGFSSIQDDRTKVGKGFLKMSRYISFITFPAMAGLAVVAPEAIYVFFGDRWMPAAEVLRVLTIVGAVSSIQATTGLLFISQGRSDIELKWSLFGTTCYVVGFFAGLPWGINGVAVGYAIAFVLSAPICFFIALRLVGLELRSLAVSLAPAMFGAAALGLSLAGLRATEFVQTMNVNSRLLLLVCVGVAIYAGFTLVFRREFMAEVRDTLKQALQRRTSVSETT